MPFNGSGGFTRVRNWVADAAAAIRIRADYHDTEDDGFAAGLSNAICKDGQTTVTQNIPFNAKRIVNLGDPVNPQDAATKASSDAAIVSTANLKVAKAGDTMTGGLNINMAYPSVALNKTAVAQHNSLYGQLNSVARWMVSPGDATAETGGNVGSDFSIYHYDDAGAYLGQPFTIRRNTGHVYLNYNANVGGALVVSGGTTCAGNLWVSSQIQSNTSNLVLGGVGGNVYLRPHGVANVTSEAYQRSDGWFVTPALQSGAVNVSGVLQTFAQDAIQMTAPNGQYCRVRQTVTGARSWSTGVHPDGSWAVFDETAATRNMWMQSDANFVVVGGAFKPGGGVWSDSSDARIKDVEGDYSQGLDAVCALRPVVYRYKGNDTASAPTNHPLPLPEGEVPSKDAPTVPYPNSAHYDVAVKGRTFVGLIAQEAEGPMPEIVARREGYIDGVKVTDLRNIDSGPIIFALINSVRTLKEQNDALTARVAALEAA